MTNLKKPKWQSNAQWPNGVVEQALNNITTDEHETKEQAEGVCKKLESDGFGGDGMDFPVRTWVEELS